VYRDGIDYFIVLSSEGTGFPVEDMMLRSRRDKKWVGVGEIIKAKKGSE
jgi:hypothetical protein